MKKKIKKTVRVKLSVDAKEVYDFLIKESPNSKKENAILKVINQKIEFIKMNFQYGEPINKSQIPKDWINKYGINNLHWVGLPYYWRMFYSLGPGDNDIEIIAFVVDIMDHPTYDKIFKYKKK